ATLRMRGPRVQREASERLGSREEGNVKSGSERTWRWRMRPRCQKMICGGKFGRRTCALGWHTVLGRLNSCLIRRKMPLMQWRWVN
ncbi:hypothetical protein CYMTET_33149, partial [Cymbomonas tetramitiformis]